MSDPRLEAIRDYCEIGKRLGCTADNYDPDSPAASMTSHMLYLVALIDTLQRERDDLQNRLDAAKSSERHRDTE